MLIGNPDEFAIIIERVPEWESSGFINGIFIVCICGEYYPPDMRTTTLNGDLYELLTENSPFLKPQSNHEIYNLDNESLFSQLYKATYPEDGDNDYRFLIPFREILDSGYCFFIIKCDSNVKILVNRVSGHFESNICAIETTFSKWSYISQALRQFYNEQVLPLS